MKFIPFVTFLISFSVYANILMQDKDPRWVDLGWDQIDGAKNYEIEILKESSNETVFKKTTFDTNISIQLVPDVYSFRIRAIDKRDIPAEWSDLTQINVNLPSPVLISPYSEDIIKALNLHKEQVTFKWQEVKGAKFYQFNIWNKSQELKKTIVTEDSGITIELSTAKNYFWTVKSLEDNNEIEIDRSEGRSFFLKGAKIDYPQVIISQNNIISFQWEKVPLADHYEIYLFKKQINKKWELIEKIDQFQKNIFEHKEEGFFRLAIRSIAKGYQPSSYSFIEFSLLNGKFNLLLNRVQVDVNVQSDNPFFYGYGLETMLLDYKGNYAERDTEVTSSLIGYRIFLEGSYQNFYSYLRHHIGVNTHLLKNLNKYIYLSELYYSVGQKRNYHNLPYEFSGGLFLREDLFIKGDRINEDIDYSKTVTSGLLLQGETWYKLTRRWEFGGQLKMYLHLLGISSPSDGDHETSLSNQFKLFCRYRHKENSSFSIFYGVYQSQTKFYAEPGDSSNPNSSSIASDGAINEAQSIGSSYGFVFNSSF